MGEHPLDRSLARLENAILRRAAAREQNAEDTARIVLEHQRPKFSLPPTSTRTKAAGIAGLIASVLYGLWELVALLRR